MTHRSIPHVLSGADSHLILLDSLQEEVVTHSLDIGSSQWQTSLTTSQRRQIRDGNVAFTLGVGYVYITSTASLLTPLLSQHHQEYKR